jgi:hypothetical protein
MERARGEPSRGGGGLGRPVRVGLLLDSMTSQAWVARAIQELLDEPRVELHLVVLNATRQERQSLARRLWSNRHRLAFKLYERLDQRLYGRPDDAFAECDVSGPLQGVPVHRTVPIRRGRFEHRFDDEALERVRAADLDVLLRFGFDIIRGEILETARYGVWSLHHGDNRRYRGGPSFFWEMYERDPVSGIALQVLTDELDGGQVIYRSWSATDGVSLRRSRNGPYWKSAHFMVRRLRHMHDRGWEFIEGLPSYSERTEYDRGIFTTPRNRVVVRFVVRVGWGVFRRRLRRLFLREEWFVAYRHRDTQKPDLTRLEGDPSARYQMIEPPKDHYYADPFVVERDGCGYIFFEDYSYASGKGVIAYVCVEGQTVLSKPSTVLERPYHLSFPFVFEWDGEVYMVPESSGACRIELYRATRFPDEWELERVLMDDTEAVDSAIMRRDGRFWLLTNIAVHGAPTVDELFVFWADSLEGHWTPHPLNPVVSDVRRARAAGRPFELDGRLVRPAQDCSVRYGGAVVFNELRRLGEDDWEGVPFFRVGPEWHAGSLASHTYNFSSAYDVVDGLLERRK